MVGEGERKLLKEIVKQARNPVKSRIVAHEVINKYKKKLHEFEEDVQEILKQEREDKEVSYAMFSCSDYLYLASSISISGAQICLSFIEGGEVVKLHPNICFALFRV